MNVKNYVIVLDERGRVIAAGKFVDILETNWLVVDRNENETVLVDMGKIAVMRMFDEPTEQLLRLMGTEVHTEEHGGVVGSSSSAQIPSLAALVEAGPPGMQNAPTGVTLNDIPLAIPKPKRNSRIRRKAEEVKEVGNDISAE